MRSTKASTYVFMTVALGLATAVPAEALAAPPAIPFGKGDLDHGKIKMKLTRGGAVPFELLVPPLPGNCEGEVDLTMTWDKEDNWVKIKMRSEPNTLEPFPDVDRTEGVDFTPNQFLPEPVDYEDGRYQLWVIGAAGPLVPFYYDIETLELIGSAVELDNPPAAIPVLFPTLYMVSSPMLQATPSGKVQLDWEFSYDGVVRGDRPEFAHHMLTFAPPNLCQANPFRLDQSNLRPFLTDPYPAAEARPWSDYLRGGLIFDITIEPAEYFLEPPTASWVGSYSGATAVGGTIPKGWSLDIDAAFAGLAPPIVPFPDADACEGFYQPHPGAGVNFCEMMGG